MFSTSFKVGFFLAIRQIKRANIWTTSLIVFVMALTLLNLVVVSGILVGLIDGVVVSIRANYIGDLSIGRQDDRPYIDHSADMINFLKKTQGVSGVTGRYIQGVKLEANYKQKNTVGDDLPKIVSSSLVGINIKDENSVTGLSKKIIEGSFLREGDFDKVVLGSMLLKKYLDMNSTEFLTLENVGIGDKIRLTINGSVREVTIKGIVKSKVDEIDRRVFMIDSQARDLIGRDDYNVGEIAVRVKPGFDPYVIKRQLLAAGFGQYGKIYAEDEGEPKFVKDMRKTFDILGNAISSIGLVVASITIFIVIFVNAITRRKYIGILKGIGIKELAIEISYVLQSVFYAISGSAIGLVVVFALLVPFFDAHPIDFPFSDGILVAEVVGTTNRVLLLLVATLIAGYIPSRMIIKKNTLDSILGR